MNKLLAQYKHLIDPWDKMQRSNLKFVEAYVRFQKRKNREGWEEDCQSFLTDAISLQETFLLNVRMVKSKFNESR